MSMCKNANKNNQFVERIVPTQPRLKSEVFLGHLYEVNKTHKQYQFKVTNVNGEKVRLTTHDGHQFIVPKKELERELILMKSPV